MKSANTASGAAGHGEIPTAALPKAGQLTMQADWLAPARAQIWRRVHIARRRSVLDLGTGYGAVVPELVRRSGGQVVALDRDLWPLRHGERFDGATRVAGDGVCLPFAEAAFDLVLTQLTLLWVNPLDAVIAEIWRTLQSGGALVSLEPDYGGMIEYPPEVESRDLWIAALSRAGADPTIARKLPSRLTDHGFQVHVSLFDTLMPPSPDRFVFLEDMSLSTEERQCLEAVQHQAHTRTATWDQVAHLPFFLIQAIRP